MKGHRDQVTSDRLEETIEWSPEGDEPRLNAWVEVECQTPEGKEVVSYMYVNGAYLRDHVFADYVEGGHFYRYGWIPEDQIWIEDILSILDQLCTGVHEIHERFRMKYLGWSYERAHMSALKVERELRRMTLEMGTIIPGAEDIAKIFSLEGSGESCLKLAEELMEKNADKVKAADRQSNEPVGESYE